jgi:hypothetical protein
MRECKYCLRNLRWWQWPSVWCSKKTGCQIAIDERRAAFLREALDIVFSDASCDLDLIKFKIRQFLPGEKL